MLGLLILVIVIGAVYQTFRSEEANRHFLWSYVGAVIGICVHAAIRICSSATVCKAQWVPESVKLRVPYDISFVVLSFK